MNLVKKESEKEKAVGLLLDKYVEKINSEGVKFDKYCKDCEELDYKWFDFHKLYSFDESKLVETLQIMGNMYMNKNGITHFDFNSDYVLYHY